MINKAIAKITEEMMQDERQVIRVIEEHLTSICTTAVVAEKLLAEDKTLKGAYKAIESEARKQSGSCVCIESWTGFALVEEYYGISREDKVEKQLALKQSEVINIMDFI